MRGEIHSVWFVLLGVLLSCQVSIEVEGKIVSLMSSYALGFP